MLKNLYLKYLREGITLESLIDLCNFSYHCSLCSSSSGFFCCIWRIESETVFLACLSFLKFHFQKQPSRGVLRKRCSENMRQIYRRTPMPKCNFIEITLRYGCSPVNLLLIFRTPFLKHTS